MRTLLLTMLLLLPMFILSCGNKKTLVVATSDNIPPFAYRGGVNSDELMGFDIEFAKMIANELGRELEIQTMRFDELIPAILDGKVDMSIAAIFITEERKKIVNMSKSYYEACQVILVRKDDDSFKDITEPRDFVERDKFLAAQLNTVGMTAAASITGNNPVLGFRSLDQAVVKLLDNKIDAVVLDKMTARRFVSRNNNLAILPKIEFFERYYGVAVSRDNRKLLEDVNLAIAKSITTGEYMEWVNKYMVND